jgi:hypothetical protein
MRQFKPEQLNKRIKPSRFFETFIQQKGPNGVSRASVLEIQKNLRTLFLDLAFGNVVQDKYIQFMIGDPRVVQEATTAAYNKIWDKQTFLELTSFVLKGDKYCAESGKNDDLVMTLVLFAWAIDQQYMNDIINSDSGFRQQMIEQKLKEMEENLIPFGFIAVDEDDGFPVGYM